MAIIYGTRGTERRDGTDASDWIHGWAPGEGAASDTGNDFLFGWGGNDYLFGAGGNDTLDGGEDDDTLSGGTGGDRLFGGEGIDTAYYAVASAGVSLNLLEGEGYEGDAEGDTYFSIENVMGSAHNDTIVGNHGANKLEGGGGHDILLGLRGDDQLYGGAGTDYVYGGDDQDRLYGGTETDYLLGEAGADTLDGGDGDDVLSGGTGADTFIGSRGTDINRGGSGGDIVDYYGSIRGRGVEVNLETGLGAFSDAEGDRYESIEHVTGTRYDDTITGNNEYNMLGGGDGADRIFGRGGDDYIFGGAGADVLDGGTENDTISYYFSAAGVQVNLDTGAGLLGEAHGDSFVNVENVEGSHFHDWLIGNSLDNILNGSAGFDFLDGHGGNDTLYGGDENDHLWGGAGADFMDGGGSSDTFVFKDISESPVSGLNHDEIDNFGGGDRIDLWAIDANQTKIPLAGGDQDFDFIGEGDFTAAGQLRIESFTPAVWNVYGEVNGDGAPDFMIRMDRAPSEHDFIL